MHRHAPLTAAIALSLTLLGCNGSMTTTQETAAPGSTSAEGTSAESMAKQDAAPSTLDAAISGAWRAADNVARDRYRHPADTLAFFGLKPTDTVIEITPGGGWYTEILAPYVHANGHYIAALPDPMAAEAGKARDGREKAVQRLETKFTATPEAYGGAKVVGFDPKAPVFGAPGSADAVLTFRNAHNWVAADNAPAYFKAFYEVLKPGGVLGVVDHRAKAGTNLEAMKNSGYLTPELVIGYATAAGFELDARSEVNANPKDTTDHPNGVWTLPPTNSHDDADDAKYKDIGESDRMTLRFVRR